MQTNPLVLVSVSTQGFLFDMDGVLVSSIGAVNRCWRIWRERYGVSADFDFPHGTRALDIIRTLKPEWNDAEALGGLRVIEDLELEDTSDLKVLPGVRTLLQTLPLERWTIVTSATHRLLVSRLETAGLPAPERLISAETVQRGKPDPEPYRRGAELLGFAAANCIVVEDAPSGVSAGLAAGSRVLAVLGTHTRQDLADATWVIPSLADLSVTVAADSLELRFSALF